MSSALVRAVLGAAAGFAVGGLYFGGLWMTVNRAVAAGKPNLLLGASFLVRSTALLAVFYLLLLTGWETAAGGMCGFLAARKAWTLSKGTGDGRWN